MELYNCRKTKGYVDLWKKAVEELCLIMYYGAYKGVRDGAWRCLCDYNIKRLPVDVAGIARESGIKIVKNSMVNELAEGENGRSYYDGESWIIVYDDSASIGRARQTVAHELGHIFLGHELEFVDESHIRMFSTIKNNEKEADMFAERILCPSCVLWGRRLSDIDDIIDTCMVTEQIAKKRSRRLKTLLKRDKFLSSELEQGLYENFREYIESFRK